MARILIIDDDQLFCSVLRKLLQKSGHSVDCSHTLQHGLDSLLPVHEIVLLDVRLPDGSGLEAIEKILSHPQHAEIIVITSSTDPSGASLAVRSGVWEYIDKCAPLDHVETSVAHALKRRRERIAAAAVPKVRPEWLVGTSSNFISCLDRAIDIATADASVLIRGETGTGKELFARAIHCLGRNKNAPFVVVDCAALSVNLAESVLFGHVRGAFTSAVQDQEGLIAAANGGVLFLDELGELPISIQKSFLRVLQEQKYRRVGSANETTSRFRVLAATNRNLEEMVANGSFRQDLLYRLNTVTINIPSLKNRVGDVEVLAKHFLEQHLERTGGERKTFSSEFLQALAQHSWPGNVRELRNAIDASLINAGTASVLFPADLPCYIREENARRQYEKEPLTISCDINLVDIKNDAFKGEMLSWREHKQATVAHSAKIYFENILDKSQGDLRIASNMAGMSLPNLYATLNKYKISAQKS